MRFFPSQNGESDTKRNWAQAEIDSIEEELILDKAIALK